MLDLLKKDIDVLTKKYKMHVLLLVFFLCAGSVGTSDEFFSTFPMVICSWFTANLITHGEREGIGEVSKKLYVQEKYLFQLIVVCISMVICVAGLSSRYPVDSYDFSNVLLTMLAAALLVPSAVLPIIFKNGAEKSFLKYLAVLVIGVALCYYFSAAFEHRYIAPIGLGVCIAAGLLFLAIYFGSYLLSVKFYEKRES